MRSTHSSKRLWNVVFFWYGGCLYPQVIRLNLVLPNPVKTTTDRIGMGVLSPLFLPPPPLPYPLLPSHRIKSRSNTSRSSRKSGSGFYVAYRTDGRKER